MNKHKLKEILENLPSDFNFSAVIEERAQNDLANHAAESMPAASKAESGAVDLLETLDSMLYEALQEAKNIENTERVMRDYRELDWEKWQTKTTYYYDVKSKRWENYDEVIKNKIKDALEGVGVILDEQELTDLCNGTHYFYRNDYGESIWWCRIEDFLEDLVDHFVQARKT